MAKTADDIIHGVPSDYEIVYPLGGSNVQQNSRRVAAISALAATDLLSFAIGLGLSLFIRLTLLPPLSSKFVTNIPQNFISNIWWVAAILVACLAYEGLYTKHQDFWREAGRIVAAVTLAFLIVLAIISLAKLGDEFSRTTLMITYSFLLFLLPAIRYISKRLLYNIGIWNQPVLIMGAGETGRRIALAFASEPYIGYRVFGFLDDDMSKRKEGIDINGVTHCVLGGFGEAARLISQNNIELVIMAVPHMPGDQLVKMANDLKHYTHSVLIVPDLMGISITGGQLNYLSNDQILAYSTSNNLANPLNVVTKRVFDTLVGGIIFIMLLPILLIIALVIKLDSPGPVGFSHRRVGKSGQSFPCYKFRTMIINAQEMLDNILESDPALKEEWEKDFKLKNDPRVTRVGRFLRKTSLDELPQIFNVIKGEMSLVGPRPIVWDEVPKFGEEAANYFMVLPGMTGLWGVSGRSDIEYDERVQMETWYVKNWSLWLDISLLFRTVGVVLGRKGSY